MGLKSVDWAAKGYFDLTDKLWLWYESLDEKAQNFRHAPESWSVNDVFRHLLLVEKLMVEQVRSRLASDKVKFARLKHRRNALLLIAALWIPKKYKAPAVVTMDLQIQDFDLQKWKMNRVELVELIKHYPAEYDGALVFMHPAAGPIRLIDAVNFLKYHSKHHLVQLRSLAKAGNFNGISLLKTQR